MKITFRNQSVNTEVSLSDDNLNSDGEIILECSADGTEAWHTFSSLKEFNDFYEAVDSMRDRLRKHLGDK